MALPADKPADKPTDIPGPAPSRCMCLLLLQEDTLSLTVRPSNSTNSTASLSADQLAAVFGAKGPGAAAGTLAGAAAAASGTPWPTGTQPAAAAFGNSAWYAQPGATLHPAAVAQPYGATGYAGGAATGVPVAVPVFAQGAVGGFPVGAAGAGTAAATAAAGAPGAGARDALAQVQALLRAYQAGAGAGGLGALGATGLQYEQIGRLVSEVFADPELVKQIPGLG